MSLNQIWVHSVCNKGYEKTDVICRYSWENMLAVSCVCGTDYSLGHLFHSGQVKDDT